MGKRDSHRRLSAAEQHRKVAGTFEKARAERFHARMSSGRAPFASRKSQHPTCNEIEGYPTGGGMGAASLGGALVVLCGSLFVVCYAAVLTAMADSD